MVSDGMTTIEAGAREALHQVAAQPMSSNLKAVFFGPPRSCAAKRRSEIAMPQRAQVSRSHLIGSMPSGQLPNRPELPDQFYQNNMNNWGPALVARRPDITIEQVSQFLAKMYRANPDFVFTVSRDFVRNCQIPILVLPDDIPPHPYAVAMEVAMLAPNSQVSMYPWKDVPEKIPLAVRHIRTFLKANRPATAAVEQRAAAD